jgi:hypothetical protein
MLAANSNAAAAQLMDHDQGAGPMVTGKGAANCTDKVVIQALNMLVACARHE